MRHLFLREIGENCTYCSSNINILSIIRGFRDFETAIGKICYRKFDIIVFAFIVHLKNKVDPMIPLCHKSHQTMLFAKCKGVKSFNHLKIV